MAVHETQQQQALHACAAPAALRAAHQALYYAKLLTINVNMNGQKGSSGVIDAAVFLLSLIRFRNGFEMLIRQHETYRAELAYTNDGFVQRVITGGSVHY
jgi:hypothetical protein